MCVISSNSVHLASRRDFLYEKLVCIIIYILANCLFHRPLSHSTQGFQRIPSEQRAEDMVGRPVMQLSAPLQSTGEAKYEEYSL